MRHAQDDSDTFRRVVSRRRRRLCVRSPHGALIAGLAWIATGDVLTLGWLALTLFCGFIETLAGSRYVSGRGSLRVAAAAQGLAACSFVAVALVLLRQPEPVRLAEAMLLLCAVTLGNAVQASGSRAARWALVGPPAALLIASPLWVGLARGGVPVADTILIAVAGVAFTAFSVRLSAAMHGEGEALRRAGREAEAGNRRWRTVFSNSPMGRVCFNAEHVYAVAHARTADGTRLGDAVLAAFPTLESALKHVSLVEANQVMVHALGKTIDASHFAPGYWEAFCAALNDIDDEGAMPAFDAGIVLRHGRTLPVQAHYRMTSGSGGPWSLCVGAYVDMTETHQALRAQEEARRAAEEANRAKSDFLTVMSHEIRTPLNGVLGMAQAMDRDPLPPAQRERLQVIRESGAALQDLLDHLLAESRSDRGSTFTVELPCAESTPVPPAPDGGLAMRVLAAEDNPVNRMVLKTLLAQFEVEPTIVENGAEAVSAWETAHWDLILMDVQMPVMDGPTATMTIRAREALTNRPRTPILAVTANTMAHQVASYRAAGMDDVVPKPLNVMDLFAAMVAAVGRPVDEELRRANG